MASETTIRKNIFTKKGSKESTIRAIIGSCIDITARAKALAPVDLGPYRNSMSWKVGDGSEGGFNDSPKEKSDKPLTVRPFGIEGYVGSAQEYAAYQEFGTRYQPAQPAFRPAMESHKGTPAQQVAIKYGRAAMEEEFRKRKTKTTKLRST